jgi:hypothetical protein
MLRRVLTLACITSPVALAAALALAPTLAHADDTIRHPGDHPTYPVEIEPHLLLGWDNLFPGSSFGIGGRFSIPIVQNGFVDSINDSVAISFGADLLHYDGGNILGAKVSANYLFVPVVMQWNFFVAQRWSVFGEPGLFLYHGFIDTPVGSSGETGARPALYIGGRYHFNEHMALTLRIGYPNISIGVSFM